MRTILIIAILLFNFVEVLYSQDTLLNKPIKIKKFDLTVKCRNSNCFIIYEDCNKIIFSNDTGFYLDEIASKNFIFFNTICKIEFQPKRRTWEGIWKGAATGGIAGIFTMLAFPKTFFPTKRTEGGGGFILFFIYESLFMLSGSAVGGIIGAFSFENDTYDIAKYTPNQKKEKTINLLLKYQINF
ncbi:MAG: hypothetical protein NTU73_05745 [Ignavibacteriae bacterium]|nr:hypothetical protein [Ignavibacteriota bacterium]